MNDLYRWQDVHNVNHEMQEVHYAVEQARLLQEAGLSRPSLLSRAVNALRNLLQARRARVRSRRSLERESYQSLKEC
jgi:hypothetical protein